MLYKKMIVYYWHSNGLIAKNFSYEHNKEIDYDYNVFNGIIYDVLSKGYQIQIRPEAYGQKDKLLILIDNKGF